MKKIFSLLLCALLCISLIPAAFADNTDRLSFDENGEFRILIIADTQDTHRPQKAMLRLLNAVLDRAEPDLVVFTGDQIHGPVIGSSLEKTKQALDYVLSPVAERGLKFAAVFGNHDDEGGVSKETQMEIYRSYPGCLAVEGEDMTGCGNYRLGIYEEGGDKPVVNLWFFDSNTYAPEGMGKYAWVHDDQLKWYLEESAACKEANGGEAVPAYAFQHIIVPEIYEALTQADAADKKAEGVVQGFGSHSENYYRLSDGSNGELGEGPCPPDVNGGQFSAWKQGGDIVAAFFGHDHVNDFSVQHEGIFLENCPGMSFYIYGAGEKHGARLVTLHADSPDTFDYTTLYYKDLVSEKLPFGISAYKGALIQNIILLAVLAVAMIIVGAVLAVKAVKRKRAGKK